MGTGVGLIPYSHNAETPQKLRGFVPKTWSYNKLDVDIAVNYGSSQKFNKDIGVYINHPYCVSQSVNKRIAFGVMQDAGISIPKFWTKHSEVDEFPVVERRRVKGTKGRGIVVCDNKENLTKCRLYTQPIDCYKEFRVIVVGEECISIMVKNLRQGNEPAFIKNLDNGYKYKYVVKKHPKLREIAVATIKAFGLHFGAVDVILGADNKYYVLEVNSAFALGKRNVVLFVEEINNIINNLTQKDYENNVKFNQLFIDNCG